MIGENCYNWAFFHIIFHHRLLSMLEIFSFHVRSLRLLLFSMLKSEACSMLVIPGFELIFGESNSCFSYLYAHLLPFVAVSF